ncbi:MAG: EAL domain-containing protein [Immundisolibacter sp.]|uniref:EAL domain-containing protein n=3 Tax=Immundisolibacter sp. TaxID=1934948 RepID=UPI003D123867
MSDTASTDRSPAPLRVLVIDDSPDDALLLIAHLREGGYAPNWRRVATEKDLLRTLEDDWDVVLADYTMPGFGGHTALAMVQHHTPSVPFIFVSGTLGEAAAVRALQEGARDYVTKGDLKRLVPAIARELRATREHQRQIAADARVRQLLAVSADAVIGFDADYRITLWSGGAAALLGYAEADIVGQPLSRLIPRHQWSMFEELLEAFTTAPEATWRIGEQADISGQRVDGHPVLIEAALTKYRENGHAAFLLVLHDIGDRVQHEREMRLLLSVSQRATAGASLPDILSACADQVREEHDWLQVQIWLLDERDATLERHAVAVASGRQAGAPDGNAAARSLAQQASQTGHSLWHEIDSAGAPATPPLPADVRTAIAVAVPGERGPLGVVECWLAERRPRDERLLRVLQAVADQLGNVIQRQRAEQRLQQLAHYDAVTGLPNRVLFADRLERAMVEADRHGGLIGLIFVDLDRFKSINDGLGHDVGDRLLVRIAERLQNAVRAEDTVARLAGDEFAVLVPNLTRAEDLARVAGKLLEAFESPFEINGQPIRSGASLGLTLYPIDERSASGLLRNADAAMYRVKRSGGGRFCFFEPGMTEQATDRLALEADLTRAVERGDLRVSYQPVKALASGRITGVEALVRWQHPERGLMLPSLFIPLAEDCGVIHELGAWVLRRACEDMATLAKDQDLRLAVNISVRQLKHPQFEQRVLEVLEQTGFDAGRLTFEITESALFGGGEVAADTVRRLAEHGIRFSLDDFGTGYSSLAYLRQLPIDKLKLDPSFIGDDTLSSTDGAIIAAVIALARSLGIDVVAEGVESAPQVELLALHGCDQMQGYLISEPLSVEALVAWLRGDPSSLGEPAD